MLPYELWQCGREPRRNYQPPLPHSLSSLLVTLPPPLVHSSTLPGRCLPCLLFWRATCCGDRCVGWQRLSSPAHHQSGSTPSSCFQTCRCYNPTNQTITPRVQGWQPACLACRFFFCLIALDILDPGAVRVLESVINPDVSVLCLFSILILTDYYVKSAKLCR